MNPVPQAMSSVLAGGSAPQQAGYLVELVFPAGALPAGEEPAPEPPVVVFRRAPVVVLLHGS